MPDQNYNTGDGLVAVEPALGVWVSYYSDRSGARVHADEISALRAAVSDHSAVKFVGFGEDVWGG